MILRFCRFIKELGLCIIKDDFPGMAGEMAFNFTMAFFPFLIFLVAVFGVVGTETQVGQIIMSMHSFIPADVMNVIEKVLTDIIKASSEGILTIGLVITLFVASNATAVIIKGLNRAYNAKETRPFWYVRGLAIVMVIVNALVLFIGVNFIIFGKLILQLIVSFIHMPYDVINTVLLVRWPVTFFALYTMAFLNYYFMPNVAGCTKSRILSTFPGSLFFCLFWLLASWAFSIYVENFGSFNKVYGTLGAFAVLLLWLYYTSLIILIGGEINSQVYKRLAPRIAKQNDKKN